MYLFCDFDKAPLYSCICIQHLRGCPLKCCICSLLLKRTRLYDSEYVVIRRKLSNWQLGVMLFANRSFYTWLLKTSERHLSRRLDEGQTKTVADCRGKKTKLKQSLIWSTATWWPLILFPPSCLYLLTGLFVTRQQTHKGWFWYSNTITFLTGLVLVH